MSHLVLSLSLQFKLYSYNGYYLEQVSDRGMRQRCRWEVEFKKLRSSSNASHSRECPSNWHSACSKEWVAGLSEIESWTGNYTLMRDLYKSSTSTKWCHIHKQVLNKLWIAVFIPRKSQYEAFLCKVNIAIV